MVASVGGQVAGYRLDALVGRGGGGVVYRATHLHLGRTVALKLLAPELAADQDFQRRFEREARTAGALDHPHIVPVYDAGDADGVLYLAMRYVEGSDLASIVEAAGGGLDLGRTCAILSQVASALDAGHAKGLVHRDVKPANILIDHVSDRVRPEHAYLSDFGLTRKFEGTALSRTMVAGTPSFMAPERFRGVPATPAVDVYALGCVAYACLIGSPPFNGDSIESVMAGHLYEEPPKISDRRADLPLGVDAVLAKAIAKEPADRYPSCGAFAAALREAVDAGATRSAPVQPVQPPPVAPVLHQTTVPPSLPTPIPPIAAPVLETAKGRKRVGVARNTAVVAVVLAVLAVFGIGWYFWSGQSSATDTQLKGNVHAVAVDPTGGVYFSTMRDTRVFKVDQPGKIRTIAGIGTKGDSGDNGPAVNAQFSAPQGLVVDRAGNLYISDKANHRVRKIDAAGTIATIAGNGNQGSTGDGGSAILAQLQNPEGLAIGPGDDLYIAETVGHRVRKVDQNGMITTVMGTGKAGFSGDGGPATQAELNVPRGIAVDEAGNLYIADTGNNRIRKVDAAGKITTIAGNGTSGDRGDGGSAVAAELNTPRSVAVDRAGNLYIADSSSHRIRKVDVGGRISTMAGNGIRGFSGDGGPANRAQLAVPNGVAVDRDGNVYIGDYSSYRVRKVDPGGTITTVAGAGPGYPGDGGPATQVYLSVPKSVFRDKNGLLYIAESASHRVRRVDPGGEITTIAGTGIGGFSGDGGLAVNAQLNEPFGVTVDPDGNVYIADTHNHRVRKVTPDGKITTLVGTGASESSAGDNGPAGAADVRYPIGLAIGGDRSLYVAGSSDRIRRIDPAGVITTTAGTGTRGASGDGGPAGQAQFAAPGHICFDRLGNLFIADIRNNRIRRIDQAGTITTVAGTGAQGFSGDGAPARDAQLNNPEGVAVDDAGNLYIADRGNNRVRKVDPGGRITTIVGTGVAGISGDRSSATSAQLDQPTAVSAGADGTVLIADGDNGRIRKVDSAGVITTVVGPDSSDGN